MSSWVCVDASFVVRLVTGGPHAEEIADLWLSWQRDAVRVAAPGLLRYEVTNALRWYAAHGEITAEEAAEMLDTALALGIELRHEETLHRRALEIAARYELPVAYDAHTVALAERLGASLWTTDARLARRLSGDAERVRLIGAG